MMIPASSFLTEEQQQQVEEAIAHAERQTSAEIVCAVSTESGQYDRAESVIGLIAGVLLLVITNVAVSWLDPWTVVPTILQVFAVVGGFILGSWIASYTHGLRRLVVSRRETSAETARAASIVYRQQFDRLDPSQGGVLIYVSIAEREVVIAADATAFDVLQEEGVSRLRDLSVDNLKRGKRTEAFLETIQTCGEMLQSALPAAETNEDLLSNAMLLIHPRPGY